MAEEPRRVVRVVTLPVREIVDPGDARTLDAFRPAWRLATDLANWAQRELAIRDVRRTPDMPRLPKYDPAAMFGTIPRTSNRRWRGVPYPVTEVGDPMLGNLYALWSRTAPAAIGSSAFPGCAVAARDVLTAVEKTWTGHKDFGRFAVMWRGEARPCVFRFPYPWPVPSDRGKTLRIWRGEVPARPGGPPGPPRDATPDDGRPYRAEEAEARRRRRTDGSPLASLPLPGGRVTVRLADDPDYARQLRQFAVLLADPTRLKQGKVTGRWKAGRLVGADLRLVGSFDAAADRTDGGVAVVRTDPHALLVCEVRGRPASIWNADDVRRLAGHLAHHAAHKVRLQRVAEDLKREKRVPAARRAGITAGVGRWCEKHHHRMQTALHQVSDELAGLCDRAGVEAVVYDDAERGYLPAGFPWADLRAKVAYKLDALGVGLVEGGRDGRSGGSGESETPEGD